MKIEINKDFEEKYQSTYKGLKGSEVVAAAIALILAGIVAWAAWHFLGIAINISVYFGIPFMVPVVMIGFYKYQGTSLAELGKEFIYFVHTRELPYEAGEYKENPDRKFTMERSVNKKDGNIQWK